MFVTQKKQKYFTLIIIFLIIGSVFWFVFSGEQVEAYKVKRQTVTLGVTTMGTVYPFDIIAIAPLVSGQINKLYITHGDFVRKGQLIAVIDAVQVDKNVKRAQIQVDISKIALQNLLTEPRSQKVQIAKSQIKEHEEAIKTRKQELERINLELEDFLSLKKRLEGLYKEGAVSFRDFEKSKFIYLETLESIDQKEGEIKQHEERLAQAKENLSLIMEGPKKEAIENAKKQIEASQIELKIAKDNLKDHYVYAPIDGYISEQVHFIGDVVNATAPIFKMKSLDRLVIVADVEEHYMGKIEVGQKSYSIFDAYPDKIFKNNLIVVIKDVDSSTGTFVAKTPIENTGKYKFVPGMTADVTIITDEIKNAIVIPLSYLYTKDREQFVFIKANGFIKKQNVKIKKFDNNRIQIIDGLKEGNVIVTALSNKRLAPGEKIRIVKYYQNNKEK